MKLLVVLLLMIGISMGARILAVFPFPAKSHHILIDTILTTLAGAGHEVVSYSGIAADKTVPNLTVVHLTTGVPLESMKMTPESLESILNMSPVGAATYLWSKSSLILGNLNEDKAFLQLINSNEQFDLVITETFFAQEVLLALGHRFKAPVISLHPFGAFELLNRVHGNSLNIAFIPDYGFPYSDRMSFYQRAVNAYSILSVLYKYFMCYIPEQDRVMRKIFNDSTLPPLTDMMVNNLALTFTNAHPYVHYAQPYTPNIIPIGGIHLTKERKPLPPDMKKFLDEAVEGVIYFSVGSIVPDHLLSEKYFNDFIAVFNRLPQKVLWKTNRDLKTLPNTIMTSKWVLQQDVLAHPNVKVFMTHGGLFSQHEAIHAGVPVICTPYFGDQPMNAKFYEEKGIGVILPFQSLSQETIQAALTTVLSDSKYRDNMARMSRIYRDRPVSPADSLVFWVEYVLRHGGASHLRPASAAMPFYQLYLLDIAGTLFVALLFISTIFYLIIRRIFVSFSKNKTSTKVVRSKKMD